MTADTGDFRSSAGLFLVKALISGNLLYNAFYAKLSHITQRARWSKKKEEKKKEKREKKKKFEKICRWQSRNVSRAGRGAGCLH